MRKFWLLAGLLVLVGVPASIVWAQASLTSGAWGKVPDATLESQRCTSVAPQGSGGMFGPSGPSRCYYDFSANTDSLLLNVSACTTFSVWLNPDEDGTNTGALIFLRRCEEYLTAGDADQCPIICGDQDGDGVECTAADLALPLDGSTAKRRGMDGLQAEQIYVDSQGAPGQDARVTVECFN